MLSPAFVISKGLGLVARDITFPGDEAQAWLTANILAEQGIRPDGSSFAGIHRARNVLWGAWHNAAFLAAEGCPGADIVQYLAAWALLDESELGPASDVFKAPGMEVYALGCYHGWRLPRSWLDAPDRQQRVRRLLAEQLVPADLQPDLSC